MISQGGAGNRDVLRNPLETAGRIREPHRGLVRFDQQLSLSLSLVFHFSDQSPCDCLLTHLILHTV